MILGIDPGTSESGVCFYGALGVKNPAVLPNDQIIDMIFSWSKIDGAVAIENIESSRGMPVGDDTFTTVRWIGRFQQAAFDPEAVILVPRLDVKLNLCGSAKAKDSNIRQALIDRVGPPGVKANPGPTYGVTKHAWAALAVAVTASDALDPVVQPKGGVIIR